MIIKSVEFIASVYKPEQVPQPRLPEIAFFGRSNVGKSTLLNALTGKKMARVSSTPGKTQCLNYYKINEAFYLIDAPGYGYAKVERKLREAWQRNLGAWLTENDRICLAVLIIDARIEPQASDLQMAEFLQYYHVPTLIAANKADKLKNSERKPILKSLQEAYGTWDWPIGFTSGETGEGKVTVLNAMDSALKY